MSNTCRIKIVRGDSQIEAEGDKRFVLDMLCQYWIGSGAKAQKQEVFIQKPVDKKTDAHAEKPISAGEFIRQLGFTKHTDMVLAFGYYLERISGLAAFTAADINACYYEAKLESSNSSQMIVQNIRNGRIMPAKGDGDKGRKVFVLTRSGEEFLQDKITPTSE